MTFVAERLHLAGLGALASTLLLAGCTSQGGGASSTPSSAANTAPAAAASSGASPGPAQPRALSLPAATPAASSVPAAGALPLAAPTPPADPTLQRGDAGDAVRIFQDLLDEARRRDGLPEISTDGSFGPRTEAALSDFQRTHGVAISGVVDADTWTALHAAIRPGTWGSLDPVGAPLSGETFIRPASGKPRDIEIHVLAPVTLASGASATPLLAATGMAVDADGAGTAWQSDPSGQPNTSLRYPGGASLDPTVTPYFVLPLGCTTNHPDVSLGDVAAVLYRGQVTYAIFGDEGPHNHLGEGSIALANALGINPSPTRGGVESGVTFIVFPGSGSGMPLSSADIQRIGQDLFKQAGGTP